MYIMYIPRVASSVAFSVMANVLTRISNSDEHYLGEALLMYKYIHIPICIPRILFLLY